MKKLLSIVLAITLVLGLSSVAFAATDKITGAIKPIDTHASNIDYYNIKPGDTVQYPLTADMFTWTSGTLATINAPVTRQDISRASIRPVVTGTSTDVIKRAEIKYGNPSVTQGGVTAILEIEFAKPFVSTTSKNFDVSLFLMIGSRQPQSRARLQGTIENAVDTFSAGDSYADLSKGNVLDVRSSARNVEVDIGNGIILKTNLFAGQKYYGYSDNKITSNDSIVINKYPSISEILRLNTINLSKTGNYVDLSAYSGRYVYGSKGAYLGRADQYVAYSDMYYLSTKDLGASITGGSGNTGSGNTGSGNTGSGNTGSGNTGSNVSGTIDRSAAVTLTNAAIKKAQSAGSKTASIVVRDKAAISADALKSINSTAANAGLSAQLIADTVEGKAVIGRITLFPQNAGNISNDVKLGSHVTGAQVTRTKAMFNKNFSNKVAVFSLDQNDNFGMTVSIAAKLDLSSFDKNNIYFYSYNRSNNKYYYIQNPQAWIDSNGYVRFNTSLAGDIVVSEGPLRK